MSIAEALTKEELEKLPRKFQVAFALFCAKQVAHLTDLKEAHECIRLIELWLVGEATNEECKKAADAAYTASYAYAAYAAADAANAAAANAAGAAAWAANATARTSSKDKETLIKEQRVYYEELLNFDEAFEKACL